jgi:hypothetical protein
MKRGWVREERGRFRPKFQDAEVSNRKKKGSEGF